MKYTTAILAASAAVANGQSPITIGPNGVITCTGPNPNGNYCVSPSLGSPIIIRCTDGVGEAANCSDNLAGEPPFEVTYGECYETAFDAGDASCEKNCVVYPDNGASFTIPAAICTPQVLTSSSSATSTSSATFSPTITSTSSAATLTGSTTTTATGTSVYVSAGVTVTETFTTTYCPESTLVPATSVPATSVSSVFHPSGTASSAVSAGLSPTGSGNGGSSNGTVTSAAGNGGSGSSPTATPVGPTTTAPATFTGGAITNSASGALAVLGLAVAYFL
ncbi:hypothetical protein LSUE1_G001776 [Lachnellula suecica]|uniref:Uncharacterized protein n=1 Tax=Lachnellula suecica TaxID=602035 RepID=A0A8T9C710_9HELO|nr:hypothetical protein LSUE1_G001776 [Lachnellula suecica]